MRGRHNPIGMSELVVCQGRERSDVSVIVLHRCNHPTLKVFTECTYMYITVSHAHVLNIEGSGYIMGGCTLYTIVLTKSFMPKLKGVDIELKGVDIELRSG